MGMISRCPSTSCAGGSANVLVLEHLEILPMQSRTWVCSPCVHKGEAACVRVLTLLDRNSSKQYSDWLCCATSRGALCSYYPSGLGPIPDDSHYTQTRQCRRCLPLHVFGYDMNHHEVEALCLDAMLFAVSLVFLFMALAQTNLRVGSNESRAVRGSSTAAWQHTVVVLCLYACKRCCCW